jgi:hypothetical protein
MSNSLIQNINKQIYDLISLEKEKLLETIAIDHKLDIQNLKDKYLTTNNDNNNDKKIAVKRGRKKKDTTNKVVMTIFEYKGTEYLYDDDNKVYTHDTVHPTEIGVKLINGQIKFHNESFSEASSNTQADKEENNAKDRSPE